MRPLIVVFLSGILPFLACQPAEPPQEETAAVEPAAEEPVPELDRGTVEATIGTAQLSINYGRPELKGRDLLALLQDGQVWRLGMNEATTFESSGDLKFGETVVKAGKYSLWLKRVSADEWHLILNSEAEIWGTQHNPDNDAAELPAEKADLGQSVERFTIELAPMDGNAGEIVMKWSTLQLTVPFSVM